MSSELQQEEQTEYLRREAKDKSLNHVFVVKCSHTSPSNSYNMAHTIFRVCHFDEFIEPAMVPFCLQTDWSGWPLLANVKQSMIQAL